MAVLNVQERRIQVPSERVGALTDRLVSADDPLWRGRSWPRMVLDRGLRVGSRGGHGPIRYSVEAYVPGQRVRFRFSAPRGFEGIREFVVQPAEPGATVLRHVIAMRLHGSARLSWPPALRRLHDALIEECLDRAGYAFGRGDGGRAERSAYVRLLRYLSARTARRSVDASAPTSLRTG
ncbi:SRPBCC family protein [Streptomyces palmae]|uniref:SRPBCC family protein n=1 Tax=Streptomyces palmae TaxID=1701085 RepID=A0A4Z0H9Y7_9ACTN|nr:SRPBCC family protein [Streptomyces palmae]TGB09175.1 SRPBCC family protein [Streptomyces palmae]